MSKSRKSLKSLDTLGVCCFVCCIFLVVAVAAAFRMPLNIYDNFFSVSFFHRELLFLRTFRVCIFAIFVRSSSLLPCFASFYFIIFLFFFFSEILSLSYVFRSFNEWARPAFHRKRREMNIECTHEFYGHSRSRRSEWSRTLCSFFSSFLAIEWMQSDVQTMQFEESLLFVEVHEFAISFLLS